MEMNAASFTIGATHAAFPMEDASRVGEARRHAARLADELSLDETTAGRVAVVITELGTNLVRHARGGRLLMAGHGGRIEVISIDDGPGIADIRRSMDDGFSTGGTAGTGLGAVRRMSDEFDLHSVPGEGTVIVARVGTGAPSSSRLAFRVAGVALCAPGEKVCGDGWALAVHGASATLLLADGLGHGLFAHEASRAAVGAFREEPAAQPQMLVQSVHSALRTTRGAAIAVARADAAAATVEFCGAGNVIGRMVSGVSDRTMLTQHGTAGVQIRRTECARYPWAEHAALVIHSDGIESRWTPARLLPVLGRDPALMAAILLRDHFRGRDDATVVVIARAGAA